MSQKATTQVNLNVEELKVFLKHMVTNNRYLQNNSQIPVAVNVEGDAGLGKTSAILQLAQELNIPNCIKLSLSQIEELGDLVGFPIRQFQLRNPNPPVATNAAPVVTMITKLIDGKLMKVPAEGVVAVAPKSDLEWVDENAVESYVKKGYEFTGEKRMSYCPPEWISGKNGGGLLILDDYTRADTRFLQACMEICDRQEYISWKLPKDWHVILTSNPDNGEYNVNSIDIAQKTRFISVNLKFDVNVWAKWAEANKIDGRCINFLLMHPELVTSNVNPRAITTFFNSISSLQDFAKELPLVQMIGEGGVGMEFSTQFVLFINNKLDKLVSPQDALLHANENYIIGELRSCMGKGADYRADIASVLTTRIVNYALYYSETNLIPQTIIDRLIKITVEDDLLANDLRYFLIKGILNGNKQKFQKIMLSPEVIKIAAK